MDLGQARRTYTKEFKEETIQLVLTMRYGSIRVSKDLGIGTETIYRWIRQYKSIVADSLTLGNRRSYHD